MYARHGSNTARRWLIPFALLLVSLPLAASAQDTGVPTPIALPSGDGTLSLDFTDRDYQLILYSALRDESDTTRTYDFTVSSAFNAKPAVRLQHHPGEASLASHKAVLRQRERELAERIRRNGVPPATKRAVAFQVGSTRTFMFEEFGNVSTQTLTATLVATNSRAEAWVDNNTTAITTADAQAQIDRFSDHTYPVVTSVFGDPSDVDGDGKVLFLYTELVDQVGTVAGFYTSGSLFSVDDGGDGNVADMMYIGLAAEPSFYESLLAHEFQHLINFNQHVLVRQGTREISPLNEAMSHIAEDLVDQHTQGGNPSNVLTYTLAPSLYSILAESGHESGVRGTAYTFARSMIESFGDDVPTQMVQTALSGIENVESVSGQSFETVYETYLSRMFLAGSGLNSAYDFDYPFFSDPVSGGRSIPIPDENAINPEAVSVTGSVKAYAASSMRLMGTGTSTVSIQTDAAGQFRGILIPIPRDFRHNIALKSDYFAGFTFDNPIAGNFTTGQSVILSGTTSVDDNEVVQIQFVPHDLRLATLTYSGIVVDGRFQIHVLLAHERAGPYEMSIFSGKQGESLPFVGRIPAVDVAQGSGPIELPTDYFTGIQFDETVPTEVAAGDAVRFTGTVSDPAVTSISFEFIETTTGAEIDNFFDVTSGRFDGVVVFAGDQTGTYKLECYAGQSGGSLPSIGRYLGFTVTEAVGTFRLPVDFFDGMTLTTGLLTDFLSGDAVDLTGTASDNSIEVILFRYTSDTGEEVQFQVDVINGAFRKGAVFFPSQSGIYTIDVFAGPSGQSLPHRGSFSPIFVSRTDTPIFLPVDAFSGMLLDEPLQAEFFSGSSRRLQGTLTDATPNQIAVRLDGVDGTVGQSEFDVVSGGRFDVSIPTAGLAVGDYEIVVFAGEAGQSLPFIDSVGPVSVVASQPRMSLASTGLTFPETEVGQTAELSLTVSNVGSQTLTLSDLAVSQPGSFTLATSSSTAAAGGNLTLNLVYSPGSAGVETGVLTFSTNDPTQPTISVSLTGTAVAAPSQGSPIVSASATSLTFPETQTGETSSLVVALANTGDATLVVDSIAVVGPFAVSIQTASVAASESVTFDVTVTPTSTGTFEGSLRIFTNAPTGPLTIALTGSGTAPSTEPPAAGDQFQGLVMNSTVELEYSVGDVLNLSGNVVDTAIGVVLFQFLPIAADTGSVDSTRSERTIVAFVSAEDTFDQTLTFEEGDEGLYVLNVFGGNPNAQTLPSLGFVNGILVSAASSVPALLGDIDGSNSVDFSDFLIFAAAFGTSQSDSGFVPAADLDGNGSIDFSDFLTFASQFGKSA